MAEGNSGLFEDIDAILSTVDDTTFDEDDWNVVIIECASVSAKWEIVGGFLGLSISVIDNIKATPPVTTVGCWHEALKNWIKQNYNTGKHALPSWRSLLAAVARVDRLLFKKLAAAHPAAEPVSVLSGREREMDAPEQSHQDTTYVFAATPTTAPSSGHSNYELTFPCLDLKKMNKEEKQQLHQRLYTESVEMINKFQDLFSATTKSLKQRKVSVKELLCNLVGLGPLPPAYKGLDLPEFSRKLPELTKSNKIDDAMLVIGTYCSFFNFCMVEHIINKLGTRQDRKNLEKYREEFDKYAERHVFECPAEVGTVSEGLANMFVTLDETFNSCTVRGLELFVENLRKTLKISTGAVFKLTHVAPGSLKLTFQLPYSLLQGIFPLSSEQEAAFNGMGVANLWLIYQFNSTKVATEAIATNQKVDKDEDTASIADSALGTASVSGATFTGTQFSEDIVDRDLRDDPFLRMENDAAKQRPPDDSSQLELHRASYRGDLDEVKRLVEEKKLNPLEKDGNGDTALHLAAEGGHLDVTRYFVEEQSLVPACLGWHGWTPLHAAARYNHLEVVDYLVAKQQVDPEYQDEVGCTPLHRACMGGDVKVISYLVNEMSKLTPLKDVLYHKTKEGHTPLHLAALKGHLKVVQLFISEYNIDPNTTGGQLGRLPLHYAAQNGFLDIVKYLIEEQNTDPSCRDENKATPLHMAAAFGRLDIVKYLTLDKHCNPLDRDSRGNTPLHNSALNGHLSVVDFFMSQLNVDPNTPGWRGRTPLHGAVQGGSLDIAKYLIEEKRCNPSCLDERETTPLHVAAMEGHLHIVAYLMKEQHCNLLAYDKVLGTPLHWAAHYGQLNVVQYFVQDLKCPQNIRGPRNTTPLEEARARGHINVVEYLMSVV